ncbi:MAG: hypothetical protein RL235_501 [Chlamydiota bacterium]|jgi:3-deoxy-manno-octulosonate cytidylyltransferase (CMP-KDO synthetase)
MISCVIPARFNSSRFPGKLLAKTIKNKTVLRHTFEAAQACSSIGALFVATDDERIAEHVEQMGGEVIWTSPECVNGTERIKEAVAKDARLRDAQYIVNLQGDHPMVLPATIDAIVAALRRDDTAVLSTAATPIRHMADYLSPHVVKCVFDHSFNALYFSRSPIPYNGMETRLAHAHIGVYCYRTSYLLRTFAATPLQKTEDLEQLRVLENGDRIKIAIVQEPLIGVDTVDDLVKLNGLL